MTSFLLVETKKNTAISLTRILLTSYTVSEIKVSGNTDQSLRWVQSYDISNIERKISCSKQLNCSESKMTKRTNSKLVVSTIIGFHSAPRGQQISTINK